MRKRPATRPVWWARKLSSLRGPAPTSGAGPRPAPRLMEADSGSGSQVDASDPDFPFGEGNDRPTADAHTRCIPGRAPPTATRRSMGGPCRAMRAGNAGAADDVAVEWNRIGGKSRAAGALRRACCVISRMWSGPAVPAVPRARSVSSPRHTALSRCRSRFARHTRRHQNLAA